MRSLIEDLMWDDLQSSIRDLVRGGKLEFYMESEGDSLLTVGYVREADTLRLLQYFWYSEFDVF